MNPLEKMNVKKVNIKQIDQEFNSRIDLNRRLTDLMTSIKQDGLLHPIGIYKAGSRYKTVYGNRRLRACKNLGWKSIDAVILPKTPTVKDALFKNMAENLNRIDVTLHEEARGYKMLVKEGLNHGQISVRLGVSLHRISAALHCLEELPSVFLKQAVSMRPGAKTEDTKGQIASQTLMQVANAQKGLGLSKTQTKQLIGKIIEKDIARKHVMKFARSLKKTGSIGKAFKVQSNIIFKSVYVECKKDAVTKFMRNKNFETAVRKALKKDSVLKHVVV